MLGRKGGPMRELILAVVLAAALPAFAAGEAVPEAGEAVPETGEAVPEAGEQPEVSAGTVARGTFATAIAEREPVDSITSLG